MNQIIARKCSSSAICGRSSIQGFTYLELIFVIVIISTLVSMFLVRVLPAIDEAERAAVLQVEGQLRSSVALHAAKYVARSDFSAVRSMPGMNPMDLMLDPPRNYVGVLADESQAPREHWYFASGRRQLVYRPGVPYSPQRQDTGERPAFAVELAFVDVDRSGRFERDADEFYGVRLVRMDGKSWLQGEKQLQDF